MVLQERQSSHLIRFDLRFLFWDSLVQAATEHSEPSHRGNLSLILATEVSSMQREAASKGQSERGRDGALKRDFLAMATTPPTSTTTPSIDTIPTLLLAPADHPQLGNLMLTDHLSKGIEGLG